MQQGKDFCSQGRVRTRFFKEAGAPLDGLQQSVGEECLRLLPLGCIHFRTPTS